MINKNEFRGNLKYGVIAQGISFLVNFMVSFVLSKILGVTQFAYWQLFIFYIGYVCFFHLGLPDGIYLVNGGKQLKELPIKDISSQFKIMICFQLLVVSIIAIYAMIFIEDSDRKLVIIITALYLLAINFNNFYGMIFQAVNLAKWYSIGLIIDKAFFCMSMLVMMSKKVTVFYPYALAYLVGKIFACVYSYIKYPLIWRSGTIEYGVLRKFVENIKIGANLMFSVIASSMVLGIGKYVVDRRWGIKAFGVFSFALTLTNFLLQFINQISIVLFPVLRCMPDLTLTVMYIKLRKVINLILGIVPLFYLPIAALVGAWIPQYRESLKYLAFFLPMCIFDGKMQMLAVTYMKALRRERIMMKINLSVLLYSIIACLLGAYVIDNIYFVIVGMISAIVIRDILAESYISRKLAISIKKDIICEIAVIGIYWAISVSGHMLLASFTYGIAYIINNVIVWRKKNEDYRSYSSQV